MIDYVIKKEISSHAKTELIRFLYKMSDEMSIEAYFKLFRAISEIEEDEIKMKET